MSRDTKITLDELQAGGLFFLALVLVNYTLIYLIMQANAFYLVPGFVDFSRIGWISVLFTVASILVLGFLGEGWVGRTVPMMVFWIFVGLIGILSNNFTIPFTVVEGIIVIGVTLLVAKIHSLME